MPAKIHSKNIDGTPGKQLPPDEVLFGLSTRMAEVRQRAEKIAGANIPVLICGEGGTGKESLARWIHAHSAYRNGQFVKVNCAAIPGALLESELFGYEKGSFTGAQTAKPGRIELAHTGTLFLDEISELEIGLQSKVLHFLQDGCFSPIGADKEKAIDTRLICATNKNLEAEIAGGRFRADLFYRINVVSLKLANLCERREDIPYLAEYLRIQHQNEFAIESEPLSDDILNYLQNLNWPGNVRELSNGIARYVLIGAEAVVGPDPKQMRATTVPKASAGSASLPLKQIAKESIRELERSVLLDALRANHWNRRRTAESLKISYRALIYKIRNAGLIAGRSRRASTHQNAALDASQSQLD